MADCVSGPYQFPDPCSCPDEDWKEEPEYEDDEDDDESTTTTTTPEPCEGDCVFSYSSGTSTWVLTENNCSEGCNCDKPCFCPHEGWSIGSGEIRTNCGRSQSSSGDIECITTTEDPASTTVNPICTTTSTSTTTLSPEEEGLCAGCKWMWLPFVRTYILMEDNCTLSPSEVNGTNCLGDPVQYQCPRCYPCSAPAVPGLITDDCFEVITPCGDPPEVPADPPPYCNGECFFVCGVENNWLPVRMRCNSNELGRACGGCICDIPVGPCNHCGQTTITYCYNPSGPCCIEYSECTGLIESWVCPPCDTVPGTTQDPVCTTSTTSTTPAPNVCTGYCGYRFNGAEWDLITTNCTGCSCPPNPTVTEGFEAGEFTCGPCLPSEGTTTTTTTTTSTTTEDPTENCDESCSWELRITQFNDPSDPEIPLCVYYWVLLFSNCPDGVENPTDDHCSCVAPTSIGHTTNTQVYPCDLLPPHQGPFNVTIPCQQFTTTTTTTTTTEEPVCNNICVYELATGGCYEDECWVINTVDNCGGGDCYCPPDFFLHSGPCTPHSDPIWLDCLNYNVVTTTSSTTCEPTTTFEPDSWYCSSPLPTSSNPFGGPLACRQLLDSTGYWLLDGPFATEGDCNAVECSDDSVLCVRYVLDGVYSCVEAENVVIGSRTETVIQSGPYEDMEACAEECGTTTTTTTTTTTPEPEPEDNWYCAIDDMTSEIGCFNIPSPPGDYTIISGPYVSSIACASDCDEHTSSEEPTGSWYCVELEFYPWRECQFHLTPPGAFQSGPYLSEAACGGPCFPIED